MNYLKSGFFDPLSQILFPQFLIFTLILLPGAALTRFSSLWSWAPQRFHDSGLTAGTLRLHPFEGDGRAAPTFSIAQKRGGMLSFIEERNYFLRLMVYAGALYGDPGMKRF